MPKMTLISTILALIFASQTLILTPGAVLAADEGQIPAPSADWLKMPSFPDEGQIKGKVQAGMEKAQNELTKGLGQASNKAQEALKAQVKSWAGQQVQNVKNIILQIVGEIKLKIISFFQNIFGK